MTPSRILPAGDAGHHGDKPLYSFHLSSGNISGQIIVCLNTISNHHCDIVGSRLPLAANTTCTATFSSMVKGAVKINTVTCTSDAKEIL